MMQQGLAERFAREWVAAWNSHDLERILEHYEDDFEMSSPIIVTLMGEPSGKLKGKTAGRRRLLGANRLALLIGSKCPQAKPPRRM